MPNADWFDRLRIGKDGVELVGATRGMATLTRDADGVHTLWIFDHPLKEGNAVSLRAEYAKYVPENLRHLYE